mgnify:CR=1 FL=1
MTLIPVLKNFLFVLLLSLIPSSVVTAAEPAQVYRFGGWTLIAPAEVSPEALRAGPYALRPPSTGIELLAGDLPAAVKVIRSAGASTMAARIAIRELVLFSMSAPWLA